MNYTTDFKSIWGQVSPQEWQTRVDLAACYRLIDRYGMTDLIYNHITARIPGGPDHLLINLYGMLYKEITASSLVKIDVEGEIIWKPDTDYAGTVMPVASRCHGDAYRAHHARRERACPHRASLPARHPASLRGTRVAGHAAPPRRRGPQQRISAVLELKKDSVPVLVELEQRKRAEHVRHRRRGGGM